MRVTDMRGVDLRRYAFDFDLTFGALLMHPDGHVYHRFGGRDHRGARHWLSAKSFGELLEHTLEDHDEYHGSALLAQDKVVTLEALPAFQKRDKGACIHCHSAYPAFYEEQLAAGEWLPMMKWKHPDPLRVGFDLARVDQRLVVQVLPESAAGRAGLAPGDRLLHLNRREVRTASDVMFQLNSLPWEGGSLVLAVERGGQPLEFELQLESGWKRGSALDFSWRPSKWGLTPAPGFGGKQLTRAELGEAGLGEGKKGSRFALRVTYLVTWGKNKRFGKAAAAAGLREADVVWSVAGRRDFRDPDHLHAWWRLRCKPGEVVTLGVLRGQESLELHLKVIR